MKKGFTMIELIFVIVILGILASVAIPRLAATREDAEISTTIANLRALISEVSSYYVGHGTFGTDVPWTDVTNVPLRTAGDANIANTDFITTAADGTNTGAYLAAGGRACIGVQLVSRQRRDDGTYSPAHIKLTQHTNATTASSVCQQVRNSQVVSDYFSSTVPAPTGDTPISAAIPVGSSKGIYGAAR